MPKIYYKLSGAHYRIKRIHQLLQVLNLCMKKKPVVIRNP